MPRARETVHTEGDGASSGCCCCCCNGIREWGSEYRGESSEQRFFAPKSRDGGGGGRATDFILEQPLCSADFQYTPFASLSPEACVLLPSLSLFPESARRFLSASFSLLCRRQSAFRSRFLRFPIEIFTLGLIRGNVGFLIERCVDYMYIAWNNILTTE